MGDVAAKSESQSSVGQLLGYAAGIGLLTFSHSAAYLYSIFAVSVPVHMVVTGWMLKVASFEMLTLPRISWLASEYVSATPATAAKPSHGIVTLNELETNESTGFFGEFYKTRKNKYLRLAPRIEDMLSSNSSGDRQRWEACVDAFDVCLSSISLFCICSFFGIVRTIPTIPFTVPTTLHLYFLSPTSRL